MRPTRALLTLAVVVAMTAGGRPLTVAVASPRTPDPPPGAVALFEGSTLDLSRSWGGATACATDGRTVHCFRTEAAMTAHLRHDRPTGGAEGTAQVSCTSSLRLYDGTGYGGQVLAITARYLWINLSTYGFDNRASSYRVGACPAYLAESSSGGGAWYPGDTSAGRQSWSMAVGWNNRISSAYLA